MRDGCALLLHLSNLSVFTSIFGSGFLLFDQLEFMSIFFEAGFLTENET